MGSAVHFTNTQMANDGGTTQPLQSPTAPKEWWSRGGSHCRPELDLSDSHNEANTLGSAPNTASEQPQRPGMDTTATAAPGTSADADAHMSAAAALLLDAAYTSSHESAGTGVLQGPQQQYGRAEQGFVPRKDANDNIPCFVQTSALFTNMCGYCGTRSTSGCWRRGWEIGPNKFINLCNKCGLRHKAGKLPSVPEPPPPQLRGRAAAAAAAAAAPNSLHHGSYGHSSLQHSTSAADLAHMGHIGSPNMSGGHEAAASDPTAAATAGSGGSSGRRRRSQKPLTPKWSRVGGPAGPNEFPQDAELLAQLVASGAFGGGAAAGGVGPSGMDMGSYLTGVPGNMMATEHQQHQQQQLAALLQSLVDAGTQQGAPDATHPDNNSNKPGPSVPLQHHHSTSSLSLSHYNTAAQLPGTAAAAAASPAAPNASAVASPAGHMDAAQAVAAVLAAAAAAASSDHNASQQQPPSPGHLKLKLGKLSVGSGTSSAGRDSGQMSSPAAKKRRTKKDAAADGAGGAEDEAVLTGTRADAAAAGRVGGAQTQKAEDAAAAGVAADALLALRSSAKPESPSSWGRMQHTAAPPASSAPRVAPAIDSLTLPANVASRQVTSPSVGTSGGAGASKSSPLAPFWQSTQSTMQPSSTHHPQAALLHTSTATPSPYLLASHLQPLQPTHAYASWSPEQVQSWLQHCGCSEAAAAFKAQGIDGPALSGLVRTVLDAGASRLDERLKEDLGLQHTAARLRVVDRMMTELTASPAGAGGYRPQH